MHYRLEYVVSSDSQLSPPEKEKTMIRFRQLRRARRRPTPPFFLLELDLPFEEIIADLVYPAPAA
jgi:hypothetical protein